MLLVNQLGLAVYSVFVLIVELSGEVYSEFFGIPMSVLGI